MSDIVNRVRVLAPSATGSSSAALGSAYSTKYLTPAEAGCVDGRRYTWLIEQGNDIEVVQGVWTSSGNTAARTKVIFSKISGAVGTSKINLNGTAVISIVSGAEDMGAMRGSRSVTGSSDAIAVTDLNRPIIYNRATAIAVSIGQAGDSGSFIEGWLTWVQNKGVGAVTITPTTSTIDGASTLILQQNQGALIWSDGANYQVFKFRGDLGTAAKHAEDDFVRTDTPQTLNSTQKDQASVNMGTVRAIRTQKFTSSGTYTPDPNLLYCVIECWGGGAAGAGSGATTSFIQSLTGGGSGGYSKTTATASSIGASKAVTIGSGGAGVSASVGGAGGATSVGTLCVANGGQAGGVPATVGTGTDIAAPGSPGVPGWALSGSSLGGGTVSGGNGGNTSLGGGGAGVPTSTQLNGASAAANSGSGGSGSASYFGNFSLSGGNGGSGYVLITEYCSK